MRVLFAIAYPGYLRYYDTTIRELGARGHEVLVVFESPHKQAEAMSALDPPPPGVTVLERFPRRKDRYDGVARDLRRTVDYVRWLEPAFASTPVLRRRMDHTVPPAVGWLRRLPTLPAPLVRAVLRAGLVAERALPSAPRVERFLRKHAPDVVVVSPLVMDASRQTELVKSAKAIGIPTVVSIASWDNLSTKGLVREPPDRLLVWNDVQLREAREMHFLDADTVTVTGAQPWDRWFERRPQLDRAAFCARVGLPSDRPFVLFVGSTASISAPEAEVVFVRRWVEAIRRSALDDLGVLVRPHPYNPGLWAGADLSDLGATAIWPRGGANIVDEQNRWDFFHSLYHASAVVGVNTSAMLEAAVLGRTVHTVRAPEFADTQDGTVHFRYMLPEYGGPVIVARDLGEHVSHLSATLADPEAAAARVRSFVERFVRPGGLERPATPIVADAIESAASLCPLPPRRTPSALLPVRSLLLAVGLVMSVRNPRARRVARDRLGTKLRGAETAPSAERPTETGVGR